jgi:hypothetical protein
MVAGFTVFASRVNEWSGCDPLPYSRERGHPRSKTSLTQQSAVSVRSVSSEIRLNCAFKNQPIKRSWTQSTLR